ncbi:MAG TPA: sigma-54 dependent transcriptional regulator [Nitrospiria bacterium]|nr:sigma-54 dependent transcriptional regulator [Nitrospiria bacterium]
MMNGKLTVLSVKHGCGNTDEQKPHASMMLNHVQLIQAGSHHEALRFLKEHPCDLVLYTLLYGSEREGEEVQNFLREAGKIHKPPIIIMSPEESSSTESKALMARIQGMGEFEWIKGSVEDIALFKLYDRLIGNRPSLSAKASYSKWGKGYQFQGMVGRSPAILKVFSAIERIAPYNTTVLITGETGTGKEMVAKSIHALSPRRSMRFVACNCAAMPEALLESELFGHVKGAFTGAIQQRDGLFRHSHGGTIFLDEIGDMPLPLQAKLLRVIEEQEIRPVGSDNVASVDIRVVVATHQDLWHSVQSGSFRKDLFYRLNVARVELPPLRERQEDIPILCDYFLDVVKRKNRLSLTGCSEEAMRLLMLYDWPGNIRELKNTLESATLMVTGDHLAIRDFPPNLQEYAITHQEKVLSSSTRLTSIEVRERSYIEEVLSRCNGNKAQAAQELGLSRRSFYRRLEKYQLPS